MTEFYQRAFSGIYKILWVGLFLLSTSSQSADKFSHEQQLENLINLKKDHAPSDPFPELEEVFHHNIKLVEKALQDSPYHHLFVETVSFIEETCWHKSFHQPLLSYNVAYHILSFLLSLDQSDQETQKIQLMTNFNKMKDILKNIDHLPLQKVLEHPLFESYFWASHVGLYPLFIFSETGIMPLDLLNKSFAYRIPLCGIPLKRSSYDGYVLELSEDFLAHDVGHISFEQGYITWPFERDLEQIKEKELSIDHEFLHILYETHARIFHQIEQTQQSELERQRDHFCLFFLGHETFFALDRRDRRLFLKESAYENVIKYFEDLLASPQNSFVLSPGVESSICHLISEYSLAKNQKLNFQEILKHYEKNGILLTKMREYNYIFDVQTLLKMLGIEFSIWDDENQNYIAQNESVRLMRLLENFYKKYF